jgi:RNA polymerase sigma-70 factor (ECF subfamily)
VPLLRGRPASGQEQAHTTPVDASADDAVLVAAARVQPEAFTFLYDRYAPRIYAYCYLRLSDRQAAEDAMSEVFIKAFGDLPRFRGSGRGGFAGWLFRIAQYTVADAHRRNRRGRSLALADAENVADPDASPEERAAADSELAQLRAALRRLPDDQRAVLELQLAELSPQEIAAALGRSLNAVRLLRLRAIRAIRPLLDQPLADEPGERGARAC